MAHEAAPAFTPRCRILRGENVCRFTFFCEICEHSYPHRLFRQKTSARPG